MNFLRCIGFHALAAVLLLGASTAQAANRGAYAGISTISPCPSFCGGTGGHSEFDQHGGPTLYSAEALLNNSDGFGTARATLLEGGYLPELGVYGDSTSNSRVTSQAVGYQAFEYAGSEPTTVDLELALEGSASAPVTGGASARASVAVILGDDLPFYTSYATLVFEEVALNPELDLLGTTELFLSANLGEVTVTGSISIDLEPGDKFYVWAGLLGTGVRDGLVDADNTFTATFSDATNIVPVPEPVSATLSLATVVGVIVAIRNRRLAG